MKFVISTFFLSLIGSSSVAFAKRCEFPDFSAPQGFVCDARGFLVPNPIASDLSDLAKKSSQIDEVISIYCSKPTEIGLFAVDMVINQGIATANISQGSHSWIVHGTGGYSIGKANTRLAGLQVFSFQLDDGSQAWVVDYPITNTFGPSFKDAQGLEIVPYCNAV